MSTFFIYLIRNSFYQKSNNFQFFTGVKKMSEKTYSTKKRILFGLSAIPDQMTYQAFNLFVFTYYFAVVGLGTIPVMIGFIVWSLWNSVNDPLLGGLSDRTKHKGKWGKRKAFMIISLIPLSLIMIFLFTVPFATDAKVIEFAYFLFIIMLFEFCYTLWDVNVNALFPEMFPNELERAKANVFVKAFTVVAVILASLPSMLLSPLAPVSGTAEELAIIKANYITAGIILGAITFIMGIPFLLKGIEEDVENQEDFDKRPSFKESVKITVRNKEFLKFTFSNMLVWTVFNSLITILPLYSVHVLKIEQGLIVTLSLASALIVAAFCLPLHRKLGQKLGTRNGLMLTLGVWIFLLIPFLFLQPGDMLAGILITAIQGISLSGCLFYVDILHGDVIDEDAINFGIKRSASFYGVNAFIHRFSTILVILTIGFVFQGTSWAGGYQVNPDVNVIIGIKIIMVIFPSIVCVVAIIILSRFKLVGDRLDKMREKLIEVGL